ncbi:MAG: hypothetical protein DCC68_08485 [Planctomycetota bacterium]|nr:MAG: hypothetical protein DCC68_08485 [Planctomycetota bacterium]
MPWRRRAASKRALETPNLDGDNSDLRHPAIVELCFFEPLRLANERPMQEKTQASRIHALTGASFGFVPAAGIMPLDPARRLTDGGVM